MNQLKPLWPTETYVQAVGPSHQDNQQSKNQQSKNRKPAVLEGRTRLVVKLSSEINAAEFVKQTVPQCQQPIKGKTEESSHKPCGLRLPSRAEAASRMERNVDPPQHNAAAQ